MRITVLGKSPAWQDRGGTCSGYLVEQDGFTLLLDCGTGVFAALREQLDYLELDAVLITHMHGDHFFDLVPYGYALLYSARQQPVPVAGFPGTRCPARPVLRLPPGGRATLTAMLSTFAHGGLIDQAFDSEEYDPAAGLELGPLRIRFQEVPHYTLTFAVDITGPDGARFTFGADCSPNDGLVEIARDTDLLVIEATLPRPERDGVRGHLTAGEAGEIARRAGARSVVLTHYSDELDAAAHAAEGAAGYGRELHLAREGDVYEPVANQARAS